MTSFDIVSLDLFETLVHFKAHSFDSRSTLENAFQNHPEVPKIPFEIVYTNYYQIVRSNMRNYESETEFRNDQVLLDIWKDLHNVEITPKLKKLAYSVITTYFKDVTNLIQPFPDVYKTLDYLSDNYKLVLLSNHSWAPNGEELITHFQLREYFDKIIFSGDVGFKKPSPRIFDIITSHFQTKKENILHCGDDYIADIIGALRYGFKALWIENSKIKPEEQLMKNHPNYLGGISEIKELPDFLEAL